MEDHLDTAEPEPVEGAGSRGGGLGSTVGRYRALLDATPDLIFHLDREGRFLDFVSPKGQQLAIAPSEFLGRTVSELLPEDLARQTTRHIQQALQTGETQVFQCRVPVPLPDGNLRDYEARIAASGKDEVVAIARDITPSRRVRSALQESEARYRQVFEHVQDVFYHMNMNGILTEVSPSAKWWGYGPDELIGTPVVDIYDDPEERSALLKALLEQGSVTDFEIRLKSRDGRVMDASVSSHVVRDENGVAVAIEGIARDITPRKQAERALRQSEERLRTLVTNAPVIMLAIDREGVFTAAAGKAMSLLGLRPEEHIGRCVFEMYSDLPGVCDAARRALAAEEFSTVVDVGDFIFEAHVSPVRDADGTITGAVAVATNVTEKVRAEEALKESEETFRGLAEASIDGIAFSEGVKVLFANAALVKMLGYDSDAEIMGRPFTDLVLPEYRELMLERGRARDEGREAPVRYEVRALRKDGSEFDVEISVSTTTYQGRPARQGVIRDITERKRAEQALKDSERRYRLLAENVTDIIWTADLKLNLTFVSPSISQLTGYTAEEAMTMSLEDILTAGSLGFIKTVYAEEIAGTALEQKDPNRSRTLELEVFRKDRTTIWIEANMAFLRDTAGRPVGLLGVARDVTERRRVHEALRESEERFRTLAEAALEGMVIHDGGLLLDANPQAATILGYELSEIIRKDAFSFIAPESHDVVRQNIASGYEGVYEVLLLKKDGTTLPVEICGRAAYYQGRPVRIGVIRDISERKRAEEALQRARDELEMRVERRMGRAARYKLTFRELTVLYLVAAGMADKEIASRLGISPRTASKHVENILGKMKAISRTEAGVRAIQEGLVESLG